MRILLFLLVSFSALLGQTITYTLPASITICGGPETFTITITNNTTNTVVDAQLTVQFPTGIEYVPGSVSSTPAGVVSELNITKLDTPIFGVANIPVAGSVTITLQARAKCELKDFIADPNNDVKNDYILTYGSTTATKSTSTYNVNVPGLIFSSITNQTYTGLPGDKFVREFTITNSGDAPLSEFYFSDVCGNGLTILGADNGTVASQTATSINITFNGTHFTSIGNGDAFFDPNETIIVRDTVKILNCNDLQSTFELGWGCYGDTCAKTIETGGVTITNSVPNLDVSPNTVNSTCYGDPPVHDGTPSVSELTITNTGTGDAYNIVIDIRQCYYASHTNFYPTTHKTRFDTSSVEISFDGGTTWQKISPDSVDNKNFYSCFSDPNPIGRMWFSIDTLKVGQSVQLRFDMYHCCGNDCYQGYVFRGWCYQVTYENLCQTSYLASGTGISYHSLWQRNTTYQYPTDVFDGDNFDVCFSYQQWSLWQPYNNSNAFWEVIIEIPKCFTYNSHTLTDVDGTVWSSPDDMFWNGDSLILRYKTSSRPSGFQYWRWPTLCLNLTANCGASCSGGMQAFNTTVYLYQDTTCTGGGCKMCQSNSQGGMQINVHCPTASCTSGMDWKNYKHYRVSYGQPDNDDNGVPDGSGSLDFTKIRIDRAMFTDTVRSWFSGVIVTDASNPNWRYVYAVDTFTRYGYVFGDITDTLEIFDASTGLTYTCANLPRTQSNSGSGANYQRIYTWAIDANYLASTGCVPAGFRFENGDSISFRIYYEIDNNLGGRIEPIPIKPEFFTTNVANPGPGDKFSCDVFRGNIFVIGYYQTRWPPRLLEFYSCDTLTLSYNYYLSIGPCCNNYAGGNLFPYEYRQWSMLDTITVDLPTGYHYVNGSGRIAEVRTSGSGSGTNSGWYSPFNPVVINGNQLKFNGKELYTTNGGPAIPSDDGYYGTFQIDIFPSCKVEPIQEDTISLTFDFTGRVGYPINSSSHIRTRYYAPQISLSSPNNVVVANTNTAEWIIKVSNVSSNSNAEYSWLYFDNPIGGTVSIVDVSDTIPNPDTIVNPNTGGFYPIGTINSGEERIFKIRATFNNCDKDTLFVYAGWDCLGYPATLADACIKTRDTLVVIPQSADVIPSLTLSKDTINTCDTVDVEVLLSNINNGHGYNIYLFVGFPTGMNLLAGTQQYEYYIGSGWQPLPTPGSLGPYRFWNFTAIDPKISSEGLIGAYDSPKNKLKVKFRVTTDCNYISGGTIKAYAFFASPCGNFSYNLAYSDVVVIDGVIQPYSANFDDFRDTVKKCLDTVTVRVKWTNLGPGNTTQFDTMIVEVPTPLNYVANSTNGIYNFPTIEPNQTTVGAYTRLLWGIPPNIIPGDSLIYTIKIAVPPSATAGTKILNAFSVINQVKTCGTATCNVFYATGSKNLEIVVQRFPGLWTGEIDTDWFNPYNWGDCQLPTCATDVTIPDTLNEPVINTTNTAYTHDITIETNSSLTLLNNARLDVCGDVLINPNVNITANTNSELHFTGNANQQYTHNGLGTWRNVFIEQTTTGNRIILNSDLIAEESLTLTQGIIDGFTNGRFTVVRNPATTALNAGNANSYISGILKRILGGPGLYYLPVGRISPGYELGELEFTGTPNVDSIFVYFSTWGGPPPLPPSHTECGATYGTIPDLNHGFWRIIPITSTGTPQYNLHLNSIGYTNASGSAYTIVKRATPTSSWQFIGNCDLAHSTIPRTGRLSMTGFSDFAIAQSSTPLPVSLNLTANVNWSNKSVNLIWNNNPDFNEYIIQRKTENTKWSKLNKTKTPFYEDKNVAFNKTYYYKVLGITPNGEFVESNIVSAMLPEKLEFNVEVVPNPFKEELVLKLIGYNESANVVVSIYDISGRFLASYEFPARDMLYIKMNEFASGSYLVQVKHLNNIKRLKVVKE